MVENGKVYLVGAGPGDPELLTVKALRLIEAAEVVVYDRLISKEIFDLLPSGVAKLDVGKQPGSHPVPQDEINQILIKLARTGRMVVRLKGGDPLMFGRGGEEALALSAAGILFEIVPGISSAQGVSSSMSVPLTHRGIASSVRYLTGHCRADADLDFDWDGLADSRTTLVIYMGLANIAEIARRLRVHGRDPLTPVIATSGATRPEEAYLVSTLAQIAGDAERANLTAPTLFIVGEVVELAQTLGTVGHAPNNIQSVVAE